MKNIVRAYSGKLESVVPCFDFIYNLLTYSRGATPESPSRATTSGSTGEEKKEDGSAAGLGPGPGPGPGPGSGPSPGTPTGGGKSRSLQRSRTGGLDQDSSRTPSPTKSRLNFLEGFKSTLRARSPVRNNSIPQRDSSSSSS